MPLNPGASSNAAGAPSTALGADEAHIAPGRALQPAAHVMSQHAAFQGHQAIGSRSNLMKRFVFAAAAVAATLVVLPASAQYSGGGSHGGSYGGSRHGGPPFRAGGGGFPRPRRPPPPPPRG